MGILGAASLLNALVWKPSWVHRLSVGNKSRNKVKSSPGRGPRVAGEQSGVYGYHWLPILEHSPMTIGTLDTVIKLTTTQEGDGPILPMQTLRLDKINSLTLCPAKLE